MNKLKSDKKETGRGWFGVWCNGEIGWTGPAHFDGHSNYPKRPKLHNMVRPEHEFYLCEVTVKPIKDKMGRLIKRTGKHFGAK